MISFPARAGADAKQEKETPGNSDPDSLCDALLFLAAFHGHTMTREALLFGLPIEHNRLSIPLFDRAARRAGLEVESIERPLGDIPAFVLPAVLILQDESARILSKIDTRKKKLTVINPTTREQTEVEAAALESDYLGHAFLVRPAAASVRTLAAAETHRSHWFWSVVRRFWANYSHIAISAFIVNVLALAAPLFTMNVYDRVVPNGALPSLIALSIGLASDWLRFSPAHGEGAHHRRNRQEARRHSRERYFRACALHQDGAAARLGRHPGKPDAGAR